MNDYSVELFKKVKTAHAECYELMVQLRESILKMGMNELADSIYSLQQVYKFLDDIRKDAGALRTEAEKLCCIEWVKANVADNIKTEYVTATPDVKMMASLPSRKKDPERYALLMDHLGIKRELWDVPEDDHAVVEMHWVGMIEYFSNRFEKGLPRPPGVDPTRTFPQYKVRLRPKKEVDAPWEITT